MLSRRLAIAACLVLLCASSSARAQDAARPPTGLDPFQFYSFGYAANSFGQAGWMATRGGNAERIGIRLAEGEDAILIELAPGADATAESRVAAVLRQQGWDPASPSEMRTGNGPIYYYRPKGMTRRLGWNRTELRLDLDALTGCLRDLGGRPIFLGIRTPKEMVWEVTPPPLDQGVFGEGRFGFYRLRAKENGVLTLRYGVSSGAALAVLLSAAAWLLLPFGAAGVVARFARPRTEGQESARSEERRKNAKVLVPFVMALGAYATLALQYQTLHSIWLPFPGLPAQYDRLSFWAMPYCLLLWPWAGGVLALLGRNTRVVPTTTTEPSENER